MPVFSVIQGSTSRITVLASPGLKQDPTKKKKKKKKTNPKRTSRVAQVVEWLLGKCEALNATTRKKQKILRREGIPRWRLEGGSRKQPSYSEILERRWRHTLQA
jgi:hypothetical protein